MVLIVSASDVGRVFEHLGDETRIIGAIGARGNGQPVRYSGKLAGSAR